MDSSGINDRVERIAAWLDAVPGGRACALFADHIDEGRMVLDEMATLGTSPPTVVTLEWNRLPRLAQELTQAAAALADAALTLYPALYASAGQRQLDERWAATEDEIAVAKAMTRVAGVIPNAARRILAACRVRRRPQLKDLPLADQVRQLALALDPGHLVVLLVIRAEEWSERGLLPLSRGAEWLATNTRARVVLLVPVELARHAALDPIAYRSMHLRSAFAREATDAVGPGEGPSNGDEPESTEAPRVSSTDPGPDEDAHVPSTSVSPILGRPHPGSETELILYKRITGDAELSPLFHYNQVVSVGPCFTPRVDVVWPDGRLVVEVDEHKLHSGRAVFNQDRRRDYELLASGWHVWRIDDLEIISDVERVIENLRRLVRTFRKEAS